MALAPSAHAWPSTATPGPSLCPGPDRPARSGRPCLHGCPDRRLSCLHSQGLTVTQGRPPPVRTPVVSQSGLPLPCVPRWVMPSSPCPDPSIQGCQPPRPAPHQGPGTCREAGFLVSHTCRKPGLERLSPHPQSTSDFSGHTGNWRVRGPAPQPFGGLPWSHKAANGCPRMVSMRPLSPTKLKGQEAAGRQRSGCQHLQMGQPAGEEGLEAEALATYVA